MYIVLPPPRRFHLGKIFFLKGGKGEKQKKKKKKNGNEK
jgi:hypothetical protein